MRGELRRLGHYHRVYVQRPHLPLLRPKNHPPQELRAGDVPIGRVGIGKEPADVALTRRTEQGVDDGVDQHVAVRVTEQAGRVRDLRPRPAQAAGPDEPMDVVPHADSSVPR